MIKYGYKGLREIIRCIQRKELKEKGRNNPKDFTRNRKMNFERLVNYILNKKGLCTNMEINNFFEKIKKEEEMTAQSLLSQRLKLNGEIFLEMNKVYLKGFYDEYRGTEDVKTYKGYLLKGIDGSDFELPNTERCKKRYGSVHKKEGIPKAKVSTCYDILNGFIVDVIEEKSLTSEIELAKIQLEKEKEVTEEYDTIYIMDRNYVSMEFLTYLKKREIKFVARLNVGYYQKEMKKDDEIVELEYTYDRLRKQYFKDNKLREYAENEKNIKVRIIKNILKTGEIEYLITNIEDFKTEEIIEIYGKRWAIETMYFSLKSKLQIEKFTSSNEIIIKQDIYSGVLIYNIIHTMQIEAQQEIEQKRYKHEMKINENVAIGLLKNEMINIMLEEDEDERIKRYEKLMNKMLKYRIPIRKDRKYDIKPRLCNKNSYNKLKGY